MGTHMKTTIEIADDVLVRAKRQAQREGKTLREVVEEALRPDADWESLRGTICRLG